MAFGFHAEFEPMHILRTFKAWAIMTRRRKPGDMLEQLVAVKTLKMEVVAFGNGLPDDVQSVYKHGCENFSIIGTCFCCTTQDVLLHACPCQAVICVSL